MHWLIRGSLAAVWLVMGLLAKVLGAVPRHEEIVARVLGQEHAHALTQMIGIGEIGMAAWILSGILPRWCAATQIGLVLVMNAIELTLARDLLLFGAWNSVVALLFAAFLYGAVFAVKSPPKGSG